MKLKKVKYEVVPSLWWHTIELSRRMREPDKREVWATAHLSPQDATRISYEASRGPMTGLADGQVVCMFGVASPTILSTTGVPWLLATDELEKHAKPFLRRNKRVVAGMMSKYSLLRNYVDARNTAAIRWLQWLGFEILPPEPFGIDELPFHPFEMRE